MFNHSYWLAIACLLSFNSCANRVKDTGDYSAQFKPILDTVNLYNGEKNQPQKGLEYLDSAYVNIKKPFVSDRFRFYSVHFLYNLKALHDPKKAMPYADTMQAVASESVTADQHIALAAEANFATGDAYSDMAKYDQAYRYFYKGYSIGKNAIDNAILAEYTYRMGMIMFKQGHFKEAANYFKISHRQSYAYTDGFRAFYQRQELLDNIGESYKNSGDVDSSKLYLDKALTYINDNSARFAERANLLEVARGVVYGNQGDLAMLTHNYNEASELLKKSIAINLKPGNDTRDAELTEIKLARLYTITNKPNDLFNLLKSLRTQLDIVKNDDAETSWNNLMSAYYLQQKDYQNSLLYLKNYSTLKDSALKKTSSLKRTDVNQQQASFDKENQIEDLKDHNKLQLIYICLAVLFSVMAVIIIFLVFRNLKRSKRDIVAIKKLNDQIKLQKNELENTLEEVNQGSREKDRILRAVAHDLRNPLGGIASLSASMVEDARDEEQTDLINLIKETSYNSLELINEILEAANTANVSFNKEWVEINGLINNSVDLLRFKAAEKEQDIMLSLLDAPTELLINREKIWRVISNLISNAIKFSPKGAAIYVIVNQKNQGVEICVKDYGIGIPDKLQHHVFNMFTEAKRPGTDGEKSFGLGLSICRQIIEKHSGRIWLKSDQNNGSSFYVYLPAQAS
ncbi:HAMP domain-containing histidine kinase [Mucilaginibacter sp. SMC90]|uniref:tetratricopeptide repeat-containing sensor histidine kinase n=1 Tax=Mucilaginibacter sp. SMC90 TaxID=2929803 RepID=UPI001FB3FE0E|nr:HAMP domain-containing sensor histidine kinase [Mucilaginibacter sp. SMC90]UOE46352.1 HAMP domain-containing histidine kinase [Mucilaginibacter sp. SMC90]